MGEEYKRDSLVGYIYSIVRIQHQQHAENWQRQGGCALHNLLPPEDIKQLQGDFTKSRGHRELEKINDIKMYPNSHEPFLCPLQWWDADQAYKLNVVRRNKGNKDMYAKLMLQLGRQHKRKDSDDDSGHVVYLDFFQNSRFGKDGINRLCDKMCDLAGIKRNTNHGLGRRTLIETC